MDNFQNLVPVEWNSERVLTTAQIAKHYGTSTANIKKISTSTKTVSLPASIFSKSMVTISKICGLLSVTCKFPRKHARCICGRNAAQLVMRKCSTPTKLGKSSRCWRTAILSNRKNRRNLTTRRRFFPKFDRCFFKFLRRSTPRPMRKKFCANWLRHSNNMRKPNTETAILSAAKLWQK